MVTLARFLPTTEQMLIVASSVMPAVDIWLSANRRLVWYVLPIEMRQASALESLSPRCTMSSHSARVSTSASSSTPCRSAAACAINRLGASGMRRKVLIACAPY